MSIYRQDVVIPCPVCGEPSDSIKRYFIFDLIVFILIYAWWRQGYYIACPRCIRKHILERMAVNLIPANFMWPILIFSVGIVEILLSYQKGHSTAVYKIIKEYNLVPSASDNSSGSAGIQTYRQLYCGGNIISLADGVGITAAELPGLTGVSGYVRVAEVNRHPQNPSIFGLKNLTNQSWRAVTPDGAERVIDPGRSVRLDAGTRIDFGSVSGEIR